MKTGSFLALKLAFFFKNCPESSGIDKSLNLEKKKLRKTNFSLDLEKLIFFLSLSTLYF